MATALLRPGTAPLINPYAPIPESPQLDGALGVGQAERGLRSAAFNNTAGEAATDYYKAQAAGDVPGAQAAGLRMQNYQQQAEKYAPRVQSVGDIHGVGDAADWAMGVAGQLPTTLVPAMAGGLVGGGLGGALFRGAGAALGGHLGAGAAMYPQMRDAARMQQAQAEAQGAPALPAQQVLTDTSNQGLIQSNIEALVPGLATRSLLGHGAKAALTKPVGGALRRVGRDIALDSGAAGLSEKVATSFETGRNPGRDTRGDTMRYVDAMASEAMGGGVMGAAGHAGDMAHTALGTGVQATGDAAAYAARLAEQGGAAGMDKAKELWSNRPKTLGEAAVMAGEGAAKLHTGAEDAVTRVLQRGKDADVDTLLSKRTDKTEGAMRADDAAKHQAATNFIAKNQANTGDLPGYVKAAMADYAAKPKGPFSWEPLADAVNDMHRAQGIGTAFKSFVDEASLKLGEGAAKLMNAKDDAVDTYRVKREMDKRANAQTPDMMLDIEAARDDLSPLLDEALAPLTGLKSQAALDNTLPSLAHGMRAWVENNFSMRKNGEPVVPSALLNMFTDPAKAVQATVDLLHRQGLVDDSILPLRDLVLRQLQVKKLAREEAAVIVDDMMLPTQSHGLTAAQRRAVADDLMDRLPRDEVSTKEAKALFGPRARMALDALWAKINAARAREDDDTVEVGDGRERSVSGLSDEGGSMKDDAGESIVPNLGAEDLEQITSSHLDKDAGKPEVAYHHYKPGVTDKTTGEIKPPEPYQQGGRVKNKDGSFTYHNAHAAKRTSDLQTVGASEVRRQGYLDYLREKHGGDSTAIARDFEALTNAKKDELLRLQNKTGRMETMADGSKQVVHDPLDKLVNKHFYVLREAAQRKMGEATNVDPKSLGREGGQGQIIGNEWAEKSDGEYGTTKHGRIWLERVNADGSTSPFATSTSRIIRRMTDARKAEGRVDESGGIAGQRTMLHQGLASLLTAEADGKPVLTGRVGFKETADQKYPTWQTSGQDFPGSLRMHSVSGQTYKDAKAAVQRGRADEILTAAEKLLEGPMNPKRRKAMLAAIETRDIEALDDYVRANDRVRDAEQGDDDTRTTYEHTYTGPFTTALDAGAVLTDKGLDPRRNKVIERKDEGFYIQHTKSTQLNTGEIGADVHETRQATRVETVARDNQGNKFGSKKIALMSAKEGDRVVKSGGKWVIERDIPTEVRARTGLPTEIGEMGKTSNVRSRQEDNTSSDARNVDETTNQTLHADERETAVAKSDREALAARAEEAAAAKKTRAERTAFLLSALDKGIPSFNDMARKLSPERRAALLEHLKAMIEARYDTEAGWNPLWDGKPPKDFAAFANRARAALVALGEIKGAPKTVAAKTVAAKTEVAKPSAPPAQKFGDVLKRMNDYLDNPPADYNVKQLEAIRDWATKQEARLNEAKAKYKEGQDDEWERLDDLRFEATMLKAEATKAIAAEAEVEAHHAEQRHTVLSLTASLRNHFAGADFGKVGHVAKTLAQALAAAGIKGDDPRLMLSVKSDRLKLAGIDKQWFQSFENKLPKDVLEHAMRLAQKKDHAGALEVLKKYAEEKTNDIVSKWTTADTSHWGYGGSPIRSAVEVKMYKQAEASLARQEAAYDSGAMMDPQMEQAMRIYKNNPKQAIADVAERLLNERSTAVQEIDNHLNTSGNLHHLSRARITTELEKHYVLDAMDKAMDARLEYVPDVNRQVINKTLDRLSKEPSSSNFLTEFDKTASGMDDAKQHTDDVGGVWRKYEQTGRNSGYIDDGAGGRVQSSADAARVTALTSRAHSTWCTSQGAAAHQLHSGDFWVYSDKDGKTQLALRMDGEGLGEIQNRNNDGHIYPDESARYEWLIKQGLLPDDGAKELSAKLKDGVVRGSSMGNAERARGRKLDALNAVDNKTVAQAAEILQLLGHDAAVVGDGITIRGDFKEEIIPADDEFGGIPDLRAASSDVLWYVHYIAGDILRPPHPSAIHFQNLTGIGGEVRLHGEYMNALGTPAMDLENAKRNVETMQRYVDRPPPRPSMWGNAEPGKASGEDRLRLAAAKAKLAKAQEVVAKYGERFSEKLDPSLLDGPAGERYTDLGALGLFNVLGRNAPNLRPNDNVPVEYKVAMANGRLEKAKEAAELSARVAARKATREARNQAYDPFADRGDVGFADMYDEIPFSKKDGKVQGFYNPGDKKAYFVADNIAKGDELGVALHEIGTHMGMEKMLGTERYGRLIDRVKSWEKSDGFEGEIAREARQRVRDAGTKGAHVDHELLAHFVEAATKRGITPDNATGGLKGWLTEVWNAVKAAISKLGWDTSKLTAKDVVQLAYGAARMEMKGDVAEVEETRANKQDPSKAFGTAQSATPEEQAKFHADILRRLGPQMKSGLLEVLMGKNARGKDIYLSGKWEKGAIYASVYARNLDQIGAHEAFHEFFSRLRAEPAAAEVLKVLDRAANSPYVTRQLERLLDGETEALKQIKQGAKHAAEERMAYMFQFHQAGLLKLGPETETVFQKIARFFRKVAGLINDDERADLLLRAFDRGEAQTADAAARVLANSVTARAQMYTRVNEASQPMLARASRLVNTAETNLERQGVEEYHTIRRLFKRSVGESGEQGYLDAKDHLMKQKSNELFKAFQDANGKDYAPADLALAAKYLHTGKKPTDPVVRDIVKKLTGPDGILPRMHKYLKDAGVMRWEADEAHPGKGEWVPMGKIDEKYFPRVYDTASMVTKPDEFVADLVKYNAAELNAIAAEQNALLAKSGVKDATPVTAEGVARGITNRLINAFGSELDENSSAVGFSPVMQAVNKRSLHWLAPEVLEKWGEKDVAKIMTSYVAQGIKRAEYVRRFGNGGEKLQDMLKAAHDKVLDRMAEKEFGPNARGIYTTTKGEDKVDQRRVIEAALATAGKTDVKARLDALEMKALKIAKGAATDVMALEGTLGYDIKPGMRRFQNSLLVYENMRLLSTSLFSQFIDPLGIVVRGGTMTDAWSSYKRGIREVIASIKGDPIKDLDAQIADQVGTTDANGFLAAFGQLYSSQYMGDKFRKANDVLFKYNGMEGFNRGMQVSATRAAINFIKRHATQPNDNSVDFLKELNLTAKDVVVDAKTGELDYTDPKIQQAIHQWVNGSIMRPNAAQRPAWGSDPHYMVFWHMKQFAYTFHDVIMKRAMFNYKTYGDMGPMGTLLMAYTPVMIATDALKGVLLSGGEEPGWMRAGLGSELQHGAMRAGLAGKFQPGVDVMGPHRTVLGLGGPAIEQIVQMFEKSPVDSAINALPGANVWNTMKGGPMVEVQGED